MIPPATAAVFFLHSLGIGGVLGLIYGFLRPLRPHRTALADGIFVLAVFFGWLYLTFGVCGGDSRPGYTAGLALGGLIWEMTLGRLFRPVFFRLWKLLTWPIRKTLEIFLKIYNFLLANFKKWVTIVRTITNAGGATHGKTKFRKIRREANQPRHKSRHFGRRRPVAGGTGGTV